MKSWRKVSTGALTLVLLVSACLAQTSFQLTVVDDQGPDSFSAYSSLALRSDDAPVLAYRDTAENRLKLAVIDGIDYTMETVPDTVGAGYDASLAMSSYDEAIVIHNGAALHASVKSPWADWTTADVAEPSWLPHLPRGMALALSANDQPHAAYIDGNMLHHACYDQMRNTWVTAPITAARTVCDIAVSSQSRPAIGFVTDQGTAVALQQETGWQVLPDFPGQAITLAFDAAGNIAVVYVAEGELRYRVFLMGYGWTSPVTIDDGASGTIGYGQAGPVLRFDSAGHAHVVYTRAESVVYASSRGGWTAVVVDEEPIAGFPPRHLSLVLDGQDQPLIAYCSTKPDGGGMLLKLAAFDLARPDRFDFDISGIVNLVDFAYLTSVWGQTVAEDDVRDVNGDQTVDVVDLAALNERWLWRRHYVGN